VSGLLEDLLTQLDGSYRIDRELGGGKVASSSRRDRARPLLCRLWHAGRRPERRYAAHSDGHGRGVRDQV